MARVTCIDDAEVALRGRPEAPENRSRIANNLEHHRICASRANQAVGKDAAAGIWSRMGGRGVDSDNHSEMPSFKDVTIGGGCMERGEGDVTEPNRVLEWSR